MDDDRRTFDLPQDRDDGIACPRCGCRDLRCTRTMRHVGFIMRERTCRHCGHTVATSERIVTANTSRDV